MLLRNKTVLVTGAGRGIGKGIALHLAELGADVVVNYRSSSEEAAEAVKTIERAGRKSLAIKADISKVPEIDAMMEKIHEAFGGVDILVNNSAIDPVLDFFEVTESQWDQVIDTNLKGAFFCSQACAKDMVRKGVGKIINISSVHGSLTMSGYSAYAASKGGMNALTRQLALDLAKHNIQVNAIAPGATEVEKFTVNPLHDREKIGREIPMGRIGYPPDVAAAVAFFASPDSHYVTGQLLTVDGGSSTRFFLNT